MRIAAGKCKICGVELKLHIDESYERDEYKLVPMATCNRCFDLRERRIRMETLFKRLCHVLAVEKPDAKTREKIYDALHANCGKFSRWCADLLRRQHSANVGFLFSAIKEQPERWYNHLKDFEEAANNA